MRYPAWVGLQRGGRDFVESPSGTSWSIRIVKEGAAASRTEAIRFAFGDKGLWTDRVATISQAEIWPEFVADDIDLAAACLARHHCVRSDEIEPLPEGFKGFWVPSPANIIHLITASDAT